MGINKLSEPFCIFFLVEYTVFVKSVSNDIEVK